MSRRPLQTVTLPLLVDASTVESADGECAVFPSRGGIRLVKVSVESPEGLVARLNSKTRPGRAGALQGLDQLRAAWIRQDMGSLLAAVERTRPLMPVFSAQFTMTEDWTGAKVWKGAKWRYAEGMSNATRNARLVVWWPFSGEHDPSPAMYCPDMSTAVAVALFTKSVRVCPHCDTLFVPGQDNIDYCKPAHGVAHRTARSRAKAKQANAIVKANVGLPVQTLMDKLAEAGIERERAWVKDAKARLL